MQVPDNWKPWRGPWQVCFLPSPLHWTMRFRARRPPFQHVFLTQPLDHNEWLIAEWTLMQYAVTVSRHYDVARLHNRVCGEGAMLAFEGSNRMPRPTVWNALMPMTCVGFVRSVMGLPPKHCFYSAEQLWYELIDRGATIVVAPPAERPAGRLAA